MNVISRTRETGVAIGVGFAGFVGTVSPFLTAVSPGSIRRDVQNSA